MDHASWLVATLSPVVPGVGGTCPVLLEGVAADWVNAGDEQETCPVSLRPGTHHFASQKVGTYPASLRAGFSPVSWEVEETSPVSSGAGTSLASQEGAGTSLALQEE